MNDLMHQLQPIADIVGPSAVSASFSDVQLYTPTGYRPGWKVSVNAVYKGAGVTLSEKAVTLDEAADALLLRLKAALGLS